MIAFFFGDKELSFDMEKFEKIKKTIEGRRTELETMRKDVVDSLENLRDQWQTTAGKKFYESIDNDWVQEVKKCEKTLAVFEEVLDSVIGVFSQVEEETNRLSI